jgi:hypothetical protein
MRRLVARRNQVVRHRTRIKNEVHAILHAHLIPCCPHADMFSQIGRAWLKRQPFPDDEMMAIERHLRELDPLGEDLELLDREVAKNALRQGCLEPPYRSGADKLRHVVPVCDAALAPAEKIVAFPRSRDVQIREERAFHPAALEIVETPPSPVGRIGGVVIVAFFVSMAETNCAK